MNRICLWRLAMLLAVFAVSCSRTSEESDSESVSVGEEPELDENVPPTVSSELPIRFVEENSNPTPESQETDDKEEPKPPSPEHIKGREQKMADDILAMPEGEAQALALTELIRRWSITDPEAALAFREKIESNHGKHSDVRRAYYRGIADEMAKVEPARLLDVIEDGLWWNGQWKPERAALNRVAAEDFDRAVSHFMGSLEGKQHREESYHFARRIASENSIAEALEFAAAMKRPLSMGHAIRGTIIEWAAQDVEAATQYIDGIDDDSLRSYAIDGLVGEIWKTNPQESIEWALSMTDEELRRETFGKLAGAWTGRGESELIDSLLRNERLSNADRAAIEARLPASSSAQ